MGVPARQTENRQSYHWRGCLWHRSGIQTSQIATPAQAFEMEDEIFIIPYTSGEQLDQTLNDGPPEVKGYCHLPSAPWQLYYQGISLVSKNSN